MHNINKEAAAFLRELAANGPGSSSYVGICYHLKRFLGDAKVLHCGELREAYAFVPHASVGWHQFSGVITHPIPFDDSNDLWEGVPGELRRDLCLYLANILEQEA